MSFGDCVRVELGVSRVAVAGAGLHIERGRQTERERVDYCCLWCC